MLTNPNSPRPCNPVTAAPPAQPSLSQTRFNLPEAGGIETTFATLGRRWRSWVQYQDAAADLLFQRRVDPLSGQAASKGRKNRSAAA